MSEMGAARQFQAARRTGLSSSRSWFARTFMRPKTTARGRHLTKAKVEAMQKLYGHDEELLNLMTAVKLLRDQTALLHQELAVYTESGLEIAAAAEESYAEELGEMAHRAEDKGVSLPTEASASADALGNVLSLEDLLADLAVAEGNAADIARRFADQSLETIKAVHEDMERTHSVRIKPARDAHEMAYDALQRPQRRLHDLLARAEAEGPEEVEKPSTQRKIEEGEIDTERLQAQLNVTTLRLKAKTREFLSDFTPRVHEAITEYITAQETMLNRMAAEKAGLAQHALGGMRVVRAKRADRETKALEEMAEERFQREE